MYIEIQGNEASPSLLYLHGGPGESCYEFMLHQKERLSSDLRLIAIDQRGVWRSDPIEENESFTLQDLVEDCEVLRENLGIEKWSVIGHSFGGFLALLYATNYPDSIETIILECPSFDFTRSFKNMLLRASSIFEEIGEDELSQECNTLISGNDSPEVIMTDYIRLSLKLGPKRELIYGPNSFSNYSEIRYSEKEMNEFQRRSNIHLTKLINEGRIFDSLLTHLKEVTHPTLLIKGEFDPVASNEQTEKFLTDVSKGQLKIYKNCGHIPHYEEADLFAQDVIQFIKKSKQKI